MKRNKSTVITCNNPDLGFFWLLDCFEFPSTHDQSEARIEIKVEELSRSHAKYSRNFPARKWTFPLPFRILF